MNTENPLSVSDAKIRSDAQFMERALQLLECVSSSPISVKKERSVDLSQIAENLDERQKENSLPLSEEPCNCSRSECKKMYCECLARGKLCSQDCRCSNCHNKFQNEMVIGVLEQMSTNQRKKFRSDRFKDGCTCQRSNCQKKYCECYQSGKPCGGGCRCVNCQNTIKITPKRKRKQIKSMNSLKSSPNSSSC